MAIKNWKKIKTGRSHQLAWKKVSTKKFTQLNVISRMNIRTGKRTKVKGWTVEEVRNEGGQKRSTLKIADNVSKKEGIKIARKYMKKH